MAAGSSFNQSQGTSTSTSSSGTRVLPELFTGYQNMLKSQQNIYGNVLSAFQNSGKQLQQQLPQVYQGYNQLNQNVQNTLGMGGHGWGVAQPGADEIARTYADRLGQTQSQMTSAGLGNTTIAQGAQNQNARLAAQSYGSLGAQLADKYAGYQSQIGLARQGAMMQGAGLQNSLNQTGIGAIAGTKFSNTMGNLTGQYSNSSSQSNQSSMGNSIQGSGGGSGGGGYGNGQSGTEGHSAESLFGPFGNYGQGGQGLGYSGAYSYGSPYVQLPGSAASGSGGGGFMGPPAPAGWAPPPENVNSEYYGLT